MRGLGLVLLVAGCGRLGFSEGEPRDGSPPDQATAHDAISDGTVTIPDGTTPDGTLACSPAFELCDGFEGVALDMSTWTADPMVTLDTTRAHRGAASIHMQMPAFGAGQNRYALLAETKTLVNSTFWLRGWFWLSALPAGGNGMELMSAERPSSAGDYVFVFADGTHIYTQFGGDSATSTTTVPIGSWFCLVWKVVRSPDITGSLDLSGDLTLTLPDVKTDSAMDPMTIITLGIGFAGTNVPDAQPALDLWIDDVIAHSAPVTCAD